MAFPNLASAIISLLLLLVWAAVGTNSEKCISVMSSTENVTFSASTSAKGPGYPVLHGKDVWCAGVINDKQFLKVDLGQSYLIYQVSVQGMPNSNKSVSQYYLKTSTDDDNFIAIRQRGSARTFYGPLFNGDAVVSTNLTNPVRARWVMFNPRKPLSGNYLCIRIDILGCKNVTRLRGSDGGESNTDAEDDKKWAYWLLAGLLMLSTIPAYLLNRENAARRLARASIQETEGNTTESENRQNAEPVNTSSEAAISEENRPQQPSHSPSLSSSDRASGDIKISIEIPGVKLAKDGALSSSQPRQGSKTADWLKDIT